MMKKFYLLTIVPASFCKLSNIISTLQQLQEGEAADDSDPTVERSLASGWANSMVESINGYGCWCYFENDHGKGKGQSQNQVDAQCKILHDGYTCIMLDSEENEDLQNECIPWLVDYTEPMGLHWWAQTGDDEGMKEALVKDCFKKNRKTQQGVDPWCAQKSCIVEGYFSINLFKLLTSGVKYSHDLLHKKGLFDPSIECIVNKGPKAERQCCGQYPIRFPFKYIPDKRECCGQNTYNSQFLQCCEDSSVSVSCM